MTIQITVRNVPEKVRDELAARAARRGQSMQEFLRGELERLAARPAVDEVLGRMRERKALGGTRLDPDEILAARDADRR
jgi:antitoxin FitA